MEQKSCHRIIFKLHSKQLRESKWNLTLQISKAMIDYPECVVSLNSSQALRFIDEINGENDITEMVRQIQNKIKFEKKKPRSRETKAIISKLYEEMYNLQFQKDYCCVVMDKVKDYDRANKGFIVNGIKYRRLLGTNGGIKNSTIVYVNEKIYPQLKEKLDCGRKTDVPLVPAKLEAYQALMCSASIPIPEPKGVIVVKDCITRFKEDVIMIDDSDSDEPHLEHVNNYEIEHNNSDGFGIMLPCYSKQINECLNSDGEHTVSGFNLRGAWTKGMVYTFDFLEFADKVSGKYLIKDVWGDTRDVRNAEMIITESMLKLWSCYDSWEDYYSKFKKYGYTFAAAKTTPDELENVRTTNYQFLQSYDLNDSEIEKLCKPTVDEISDVLGLDWRKSIIFLLGYGLDDENVLGENVSYIMKSIMADSRVIQDPYVRSKIWNMIKNRVNMAKHGKIQINANYAMIMGDPYALCQSMFDMEVTGLLKAGECYHKYWKDKGADEIVCFRAPMTCANNIKKLKLNKANSVSYWYQYINTAVVLNAWDSTCEAMNGCDFDGDTFMCTDDTVLLNNTRDLPTIICVQRKAEKKIVEESNIIEANKLAFNDDIGIVTNHITSMFDVQAWYEKDSDEYKVLDYRIMCGQLAQQNTIDRAKGIISKPMPEQWYSVRANKINDDDSDEIIKAKKFNLKVVADKKPYFMIYIYPELKSRLKKYINQNTENVIRRFGKYGIKSIDDLLNYKNKTPEMEKFAMYYKEFLPVSNNNCTVNKICRMIENKFNLPAEIRRDKCVFDYSILKSDEEYTISDYRNVKRIYKIYKCKLDDIHKKIREEKSGSYEKCMAKEQILKSAKIECSIACSNEKALCNILLDLCYGENAKKEFVWELCGETIFNNLLEKNGGKIEYPCLTDNVGEFTYCGKQFVMKEKVVNDETDYTE